MNLFSKIVIPFLVAASMGASGCTATPLPLPPELDTSRMELWARGQEQVIFIGEQWALQPATARPMLVTNLDQGVSVYFTTDALGAFEVGLLGDLSDTYRFSVVSEAGYEGILDCTSAGGGVVRDIADEPPAPDPTDADGDGFPASEDCDDADASVNPAAPEACDGLDNDCDGEVDEIGCHGCGDDADCSDGLFCNGEETCATGLCVLDSAEVCDDGDPSTFDYCSEVDDVCTSSP